jgi:hypothetical protein
MYKPSKFKEISKTKIKTDYGYESNLESQIVQYDGAVQSIADKKAILTQLFLTRHEHP